MKELIKDITKRSLKRNNDEVIKPLISAKADTSYVNTELAKKANASHGTHVTYSTAAPKANGTASAGTNAAVARIDHVHPLQTSVSGNAGSATKLQTARTINGVAFDGTSNINITDSSKVAPTGTIVANRIAVFSDTTGKIIKDSGYTIATSVPSGAKFTDTVYTHPNDANTRHVTDTEKSTWNAKETTSGSQSKADKALSDAKAYTDTKVANLVNSAPATLDTLQELSKALGDDPNFATTVTNKIGLKADKSYVDTELGKKANTSHGTHVTYSTATPLANGTATAGTNAAVARIDHVHPLQTTVSGNAGTATKLQTARTITLKGNANGSVSFDGSGNVTLNTHPRIFSSAGTAGTSGYVAFAQLVVTSNYTNRPIEFKLISRGRQTACTISMAFANTNNTDPALSSLRYWGTDYGVFAHKTATSTWLLYCTKSEAYDDITLVGNDYATQGVTITYPGTFITAKPTANITNASLGGNFGTAATATKATQDSAGQQINTTYIKGLSVSGKVITYTKGDGTTGTITTQDTNTTYSVGTASALGLTKLYTGTGTATDGTMTQSAINSALNGRVATSNVAAGGGTFNSTKGRAISIGKTMANTNYRVNVTATSNPNGTLGEVWVGNKTTTGFTVYCSGSTTTTTFDWSVIL